jgi:hypothetical protein
VWGRRFHQAHLAGFRIKTPDIVGLFVGKPQNAIVVEYGRVRVDLRAISRAILGDLATFRIKLPNVTPGNSGEPDVAVFVGDQPVRTGIGASSTHIP